MLVTWYCLLVRVESAAPLVVCVQKIGELDFPP